MGSFGPAIGALIVTAVVAGKSGIKAILRSWIKVKSSLWAFAFSILLIIAIYLIAYGIHAVAEAPLNFQAMPGIVESILYFFVIAVVGGPLGEEIGWRGFLQATLLKRYKPLVASLLIAVIWFAWHLPLFWLEGAAQEGTSIFYFALLVLSMSFLFTLLYIKSKGNLFQAVLFHTVINYVSVFIIPSIIPASETDRAFENILTLVLPGTALLFFLLYFKTFAKRQEPYTD